MVASLASVVPTHDHGDLRLASGRWLSLFDLQGWHEAGHAVACLHFGWGVSRLKLGNPYQCPTVKGGCSHDQVGRGETLHGSELTHWCRICVASVMAGALAARGVRTGLGITFRTQGELASDGDREWIGYAVELSPEVPSAVSQDDYLRLCERFAWEALRAHRDQFGAIVSALLERHTLDEDELRTLWQRHAEAA